MRPAPREASLVYTRPQLIRAPPPQLIEDFVRKNVAAAANVVMASPVFYFTFSAIVGERVAVSSVRALTGTMRIVPFMGVFYGAFAIISPFLVDYFMGRGQSYEAGTRHATRHATCHPRPGPRSRSRACPCPCPRP